MTPGARTENFADVDTPAVLIDLDIVERNIARFQAYCDEHGIEARPHIKTHKLPRFARAQVAAGAVGITCQKIGEAEVMVDAGLEDILITYNIIGAAKLDRLAALARRCRLTVVADNPYVVDGLGHRFASEPEPLAVMVECDTGAGRCGVQHAAEVVDLARRISNTRGLHFAGLMTYPPMGRQAHVEARLAELRAALHSSGLECPRISSGGTPNMWQAHETPSAQEHRAGTYIYNDRSLIAAGVCGEADCALTVLTSVVSRPTAERAIIDAGSKSLTSDLLGLTGYGLVWGHPRIAVHGLSEEHGTLSLGGDDIDIGARLRVVPNHACVVSNLVDSVLLHRNGRVESEENVAARGRSR